MCPDSPGYLLIAPLWPIGTSVLKGFEHQQVALPVAEQQVGISTARGIQKTFHSLGNSKTNLIDANLRFTKSLTLPPSHLLTARLQPQH